GPARPDEPPRAHHPRGERRRARPRRIRSGRRLNPALPFPRPLATPHLRPRAATVHRPHHNPKRNSPARTHLVRLPGAHVRVALAALLALTSACGACEPREHERIAPAAQREEVRAGVRTVADESVAAIERIEASVDEAADEVTGAV